MGCYFSYGFSLCLEFVDVAVGGCDFFFRAFFKVFFLCGVFFEFKMDEAGGLFYFIDYDIG